MRYPPSVIEKNAQGDASYDIYSRLLKDRIVFLGSEIDDYVSSIVVAQLLYLNIKQKDEDISLYVMSSGGEINPGLAIYDTMQHITNDVATYCIGQACSMAALLLAAGAPGKRFALPTSRIMIHQPFGGVAGDVTCIEKQSEEIGRLKSIIYDLLSLHTKKSKTKIEKDCDRDFFMSALEAKKYGLIDQVLRRTPLRGK